MSVMSRAIQHHPNQPGLYIIGASHELSHQSHSSARTLLQRGIRLNNDSVELWREYVKMELGFIESLRRRWDVLGIKGESDDAEQTDDPSDNIMPENDTEGDRKEVSEEKDEGADRRKEIMEGAIVKAVITSAVHGACAGTELKSNVDVEW